YLETFQTSEKLCPHLEFLRSSFDVNTLKFADEIDDDDEEDSEDIDFGMDVEYDNLETENDPSEVCLFLNKGISKNSTCKRYIQISYTKYLIFYKIFKNVFLQRSFQKNKSMSMNIDEIIN
uniref:Uncharacterized protein n=1 Tax=Clytia hemisphaerica TaxID=252671 RepID=A0A7M5V8J5_9CNID